MDGIADSNTIADAEAGQSVGETCSFDDRHEVADGVAEVGELAIELARVTKATRVSTALGGSQGWSLGVE